MQLDYKTHRVFKVAPYVALDCADTQSFLVSVFNEESQIKYWCQYYTCAAIDFKSFERAVARSCWEMWGLKSREIIQ